MTRLNVVLLLAVLASAIYLVHTQYESRRLFVELERAHATARQLETDQERLQVEKRAQATPLRVERLAKAPRVLVGEQHDNPDHHALQLWLSRELAAQRPQGSSPSPRQSNDAASARATRSLPTPSGPVKSSACGKRPSRSRVRRRAMALV